RAVEPVQRPSRSRRARAGVPAEQLDRTRHLALHRPRGRRPGRHLLRPPAPGLPARRHVDDPRRMGRPARGRDARDQVGALPHGRRRLSPRHEPVRGSHQRRDPRRGRRVPADRAWRHPRRRPGVRGRDGRPQARGLLLMSAPQITAEPGARTEPPAQLLRLATAGSVDDGKSTLVGRLLFDTKSVLADQIDAVTRASVDKGLSTPDLSLLVDGLRAEREQGITIDVAYRYFATPRRSFVLADTPGHVQYT